MGIHICVPTYVLLYIHIYIFIYVHMQAHYQKQHTLVSPTSLFTSKVRLWSSPLTAYDKPNSNAMARALSFLKALNSAFGAGTNSGSNTRCGPGPASWRARRSAHVQRVAAFVGCCSALRRAKSSSGESTPKTHSAQIPTPHRHTWSLHPVISTVCTLGHEIRTWRRISSMSVSRILLHPLRSRMRRLAPATHASADSTSALAT